MRQHHNHFRVERVSVSLQQSSYVPFLLSPATLYQLCMKFTVDAASDLPSRVYPAFSIASRITSALSLFPSDGAYPPSSDSCRKSSMEEFSAKAWNASASLNACALALPFNWHYHEFGRSVDFQRLSCLRWMFIIGRKRHWHRSSMMSAKYLYRISSVTLQL